MSIARWLDAYAEAFNAFDAGRIADAFHCPCLLVNPTAVITLRSPDAIRSAMDELVRHHRAQGFGRAAVVRLEVRSLASRLAIATVDWKVARADGSPLWAFCNSYNLVDHGSGWKILVSTTHETPAA